jgi:hypothetical protein
VNLLKAKSHQSQLSLALFIMVGAMIIGSDGAVALLGAHQGSEKSYQAVLETGETQDGWSWVVSAKGQKYSPLKKVCLVIGVAEPRVPGNPEIRAGQVTTCGELRKPANSVSASTAIGSEEPGVNLLAMLYRPIVRKVVLVLGGGKRSVHRTTVVSVPRRVARGIPVFRYIVVPLDGAECIQRIITYDWRGVAIEKEKGEATCP